MMIFTQTLVVRAGPKSPAKQTY